MNGKVRDDGGTWLRVRRWEMVVVVIGLGFEGERGKEEWGGRKEEKMSEEMVGLGFERSN